MLNNIIEKRKQVGNGLYDLELQTTVKEFFTAYDEVDRDSTVDFIKKYLVFKEDDARPRDITSDYDKEKGIVTIKTRLHYLKNEFINPK